jgi:hypothetical protein
MVCNFGKQTETRVAGATDLCEASSLTITRLTLRLSAGIIKESTLTNTPSLLADLEWQKSLTMECDRAQRFIFGTLP